MTDTATPAVTPSPAASPPRWRAVTVVICLVLAGLLTTPAALAYWGQRTLNDTERYVDTVGPLVDSPQVQDAVATTVSNAIQEQVDVSKIITNVFSGVIQDRPRLRLLVGPITAAVNGLIDRQVREFVASDAFEQLWVQVNVRAQQALHRLLTGQDSGAVSIQGDQVVLDLSTVIAQIKQQLVDRGLTFVANAPIPQTDRQIVLLTSPQLKQVRSIYALANPVAKWLLWIVFLLYVVAFALARRKPRTTVIVGVLIAANALLLAFLLAAGRQVFINQLQGTVFGPASTVFYNTLFTYLVRGRRALLWLGLLLVFIGWYCGAHSSGTAARRSVAGVLESVGRPLAGSVVDGVARWVAAAAKWLRILIGLLGLVVLLWGNNASPQRLFWSTVLVVVLLVAVQVLIGAANAEPGAEEGSPALDGSPGPEPIPQKS